MGNFQIKLYQVENKVNDQQKIEKVPSVEEILPAQYWKTALLSSMVAILALLLSFVLSISLITIVEEAIYDYYWTAFESSESVFSSETNFNAQELGVNWKDLLLLLHLQAGNMQTFPFGIPENFSLFEHTTFVEYQLGVLGFLLIPFLFIITLVRVCKRWLPTHPYLLILFSVMTSFVYALALTIIAMTNEKVIEIASEFGDSKAELLFYYNLFQVFTITFIILLLFTYLAVKFVLRRNSEERKKEIKLDFVLATMKTIGFVFIGAIIAVMMLVAFIEMSSSYSSVTEVIFSPSGLVVAIPLAFYLMHLLFGGTLSVTTTGDGFIHYSIIDGYMYRDSYELNEFNEFFLFLSSGMGMKFMVYMLLLLPIVIHIRTGYQMAKYSTGHRLRGAFVYSLMIASVLFLLSYGSKFGYIYMAHSESSGLVASSNFIELEEGKAFLRGFLLSLIFSLLGGFLYIRGRRRK